MPAGGIHWLGCMAGEDGELRGIERMRPLRSKAGSQFKKRVVIPARIQRRVNSSRNPIPPEAGLILFILNASWIPAFAGVTEFRHSLHSGREVLWRLEFLGVNFEVGFLRRTMEGGDAPKGNRGISNRRGEFPRQFDSSPVDFSFSRSVLRSMPRISAARVLLPFTLARTFWMYSASTSARVR